MEVILELGERRFVIAESYSRMRVRGIDARTVGTFINKLIDLGISLDVSMSKTPVQVQDVSKS